ncbi:hypothetical protein [Streptomyces decoyicus]|uniref:hypothetical protein n=1 Tax=Streptomyces decoyicus TaxID=249567 RepID=UPI0004AAD3C5|nr:hypothetical protein [Streptomyces decoyicus]KOG41988.1 hypothetical protein ADK74_18335 [Streptomyces decoyicus]QZY14088.1 hypothetical protein K7C20_01525 [Streptomyces decoyicus]
MNTTNGKHRPGPAARYQAAVDCPPGSDPTFVELDVRKRPSSRPTDQTDNREQAALMRAFTDANTVLTAAQPGLGSAATAVARTFQEAQTTIEAAERFTVARSSRRAQERVGELRTRHADDGPESLRRPPVLWRRLLWPTLVAGVAFDTMFIGTLMQRFFGLGEEQAVAYYLAYLPGFGVAVCLLAAGSLLAESVFRRRTRAARTLERTHRGPIAALREAVWPKSPRTERRTAGELPWPNAAGPVLFALAILTMVGIWARMRAADAVREHVDLAPDQSAVVLLTLVLSTAAIVVKVLAHNPCADSDREAEQSVAAAEKRGRELLGEARRRLVGHTETWWRLRATVEAAASDARRTLDEACIRIVEERARTGVAGRHDFPLTMPAWPYPAAVRNGAAPPTDERAPTRPTPPRARLELLDQAYTVLERYAPEPLENRLNGIADDLNAQFREPPEQRTEQPAATASGEARVPDEAQEPGGTRIAGGTHVPDGTHVPGEVQTTDEAGQPDDAHVPDDAPAPDEPRTPHDDRAPGESRTAPPGESRHAGPDRPRPAEGGATA